MFNAHLINQKTPQKKAYLALCLQPPTKMLGFSFLLKLMFYCTFHIFER